MANHMAGPSRGIGNAGALAGCCLRLIGQLGLAFVSACANADSISSARYIDPVERYGHFALGRPHEYAALTASTRNGIGMTLRLDDDEVFEDVAPRIVKLSAKGSEVLLAIVSNRKTGSRLVLVEVVQGKLTISAQSDSIGTPNRWLNPVGVSDLDGDGQAEVAAVVTPHIGGTLKIYRWVGDRLVEGASLDGFSNHTYGMPEQALATPVSIKGRRRLLVPDTKKRSLRLIAMSGGRLVETARCPLAAPLIGPIRSQPLDVVSVLTTAGRQDIDLSSCSN
jgi:hypothetical protein